MTKNVSKIVLACVVVLQWLVGSGSFAQASPGCTCVSSLTAGEITAVDGTVFVSQVNGMHPAVLGSALINQSRIVVGSTGSATISFDGCKLSVAGSSQAFVTQVGDKFCVKVESIMVAPAATVEGGSGLSVREVAALVLVAGVAVVALNRDHKAVSP